MLKRNSNRWRNLRLKRSQFHGKELTRNFFYWASRSTSSKQRSCKYWKKFFKHSRSIFKENFPFHNLDVLKSLANYRSASKRSIAGKIFICNEKLVFSSSRTLFLGRLSLAREANSRAIRRHRYLHIYPFTLSDDDRKVFYDGSGLNFT